MTTLVVRPSPVSGTCTVPGNKSISHRALLLGATARGTTHVRGLGLGGDVAATVACLKRYGIGIEASPDETTIDAPGIDSWVAPRSALDCANSGTTMRTLAGLAARRSFETTLDGDASLRRRPMDRVAKPLTALGARVTTTGGRPPLRISGGDLHGADISLDVASAQVKTAVLFAGLGAHETTTLTEPTVSRDHSERMLAALGAPLVEETAADGSHRVRIEAFDIPPFSTAVPGDVSSAAFLVAAALLTGEIRIDGVGLNPTRVRFLETARQMDGNVTTEIQGDEMGEPIGTVAATRSALKAVTVDGSDPGIQDELPLVALLATQADGETTVKAAGELRVKESDRIDSVVRGLRSLGADIHELVDGFVVRGPTRLRGATVDSFGDHRIAMMLAVAGLIADGETVITNFECAAVSWPRFEQTLAALGADAVLR